MWFSSCPCIVEAGEPRLCRENKHRTAQRKATRPRLDIVWRATWYRYGCAQGSISSAVMNASGKIVMECVIETKASMILQFIDGRGDLQVTFEEGTSAAWLYDLLKPLVTKL